MEHLSRPLINQPDESKKKQPNNQSAADLSIACHACVLFTLIGYYPINLFLTFFFINRFDSLNQCFDFIRYQYAMVGMFVCLMVGRYLINQTSKLSSSQLTKLRDMLLFVLIVCHCYVNYHGYHAINQAINNFQQYVDIRKQEKLTGESLYHPISESIDQSYTSFPSSPYHMTSICGHDQSINLVRLIIINVGFTGAGCLAFSIRLMMHYQPVALKSLIERLVDRVMVQIDRLEDRVMAVLSSVKKRWNATKRRHQKNKQSVNQSITESNNQADDEEWLLSLSDSDDEFDV